MLSLISKRPRHTATPRIHQINLETYLLQDLDRRLNANWVTIPRRRLRLLVAVTMQQDSRFFLSRCLRRGVAALLAADSHRLAGPLDRRLRVGGEARGARPRAGASAAQRAAVSALPTGSFADSFEALHALAAKETGLAEERPQVASVFVNRLRQGMRLLCELIAQAIVTMVKSPSRLIRRSTGVPPAVLGDPLSNLETGGMLAAPWLQ